MACVSSRCALGFLQSATYLTVGGLGKTESAQKMEAGQLLTERLQQAGLAFRSFTVSRPAYDLRSTYFATARAFESATDIARHSLASIRTHSSRQLGKRVAKTSHQRRSFARHLALRP